MTFWKTTLGPRGLDKGRPVCQLCPQLEVLVKKNAKKQHFFHPRNRVSDSSVRQTKFIGFLIFCSFAMFRPRFAGGPGGAKNGSGKKSPRNSMAFSFQKAASKGGFVAARVLKKNLSEGLIFDSRGALGPPDGGGAISKGGAGVSPAAASAAPIYDFYTKTSLRCPEKTTENVENSIFPYTCGRASGQPRRMPNWCLGGVCALSAKQSFFVFLFFCSFPVPEDTNSKKMIKKGLCK